MMKMLHPRNHCEPIKKNEWKRDEVKKRAPKTSNSYYMLIPVNAVALGVVAHKIPVIKVAAFEHIPPSSVFLAFLPAAHVALAARSGEHPKPVVRAVQPLPGVPVRTGNTTYF